MSRRVPFDEGCRADQVGVDCYRPAQFRVEAKICSLILATALVVLAEMAGLRLMARAE